MALILKMRKLVLLLVLAVLFTTACKKDEYDAEKQLEKDEQLIKDFLSANNITAERDPSGVYFVRSNPGMGNVTYRYSTGIQVMYTLRLLNGTVLERTTKPESFTLGGVIQGWQIGIPLIQKGGKIRLLVPSLYAYGRQAQPGIPANSVLDFDIELIDVTNQQ